MKRFVEKEGGLLEALHGVFPDSSRTTLRSWIKGGRITVDGRSVDRADSMLKVGQLLAVSPRCQFLRGSLKVLFEDEAIVVVEKPSGLLSVATDAGGVINAHEILKRRDSRQRVYPVHRLDRGTSGVMVFAYSEKARDHLKKQFAQREIGKVYYAVVSGKVLDPLEGIWESFLEEDKRFYVKSTRSEKGKQAVTQYQVVSALKKAPFYSLLQLRPMTGRKNQLRVHCSDQGIPIVGDEKYGSLVDPIGRLCLHAQELSFVHPILRKKMTFSLPVPESFYHLLNVKPPIHS